MALQRLTIDGFGQLELNQVTFRRTGAIEAQLKLGEDFNTVPAENGMLLAVDKVAGEVRFPEADEKFPVALNYTTEHMYDERANALKDFSLKQNSFYPRLGFLSIGDRFTTNTLSYDTDEFANDEAVKTAYAQETLKTTPIYGGICPEHGTIKLSKNKPTVGPVLMAIRGPGAGSMPDGQFGMKFIVVAE